MKSKIQTRAATDAQQTDRRSNKHREDFSTSQEIEENKGTKGYGEYEIISINRENIMMRCFDLR